MNDKSERRARASPLVAN